MLYNSESALGRQIELVTEVPDPSMRVLSQVGLPSRSEF